MDDSIDDFDDEDDGLFNDVAALQALDHMERSATSRGVSPNPFIQNSNPLANRTSTSTTFSIPNPASRPTLTANFAVPKNNLSNLAPQRRMGLIPQRSNGAVAGVNGPATVAAGMSLAKGILPRKDTGFKLRSVPVVGGVGRSTMGSSDLGNGGGLGGGMASSIARDKSTELLGRTTSAAGKTGTGITAADTGKGRAPAVPASHAAARSVSASNASTSSASAASRAAAMSRALSGSSITSTSASAQPVTRPLRPVMTTAPSTTSIPVTNPLTTNIETIPSSDDFGDDFPIAMDVDALEAIDEEIACLGVRRGGGHAGRPRMNGNGSGSRVGIGNVIGGMGGQRAISFGGNDVVPWGNIGMAGGNGNGNGNGNAIAGPSRSNGNTSNGTTPRRTTSTTINPKDTPGSYQTHLNYRPLIQKKTGKKWDRTAYAHTGRKDRNDVENGSAKKKKATPKKKKRTNVLFDSGGEEELDEDDDVDAMKELEEFDQFPMPFIDPKKPPPERIHQPLTTIAGTYIYPTNVPVRQYQDEIVASCFLENTLVALPTGLGKTFIAGTVMLNFYRWFPTGKIVFLMPTKPLVYQQHEACQSTCGIPSKDAATVMGEDGAAWRDRIWSEKRVFYATPQTFLIDMSNGRLNAKDVVLVVVDEAHKASGNHSYVQCISYLQANHPYFRIVALTATPGRTTEKVQEVVDKLHISRIEIREAESPEISKYMFKKHVESHVVELSPDIEEIIDMWTKIMAPPAKALESAGHLRVNQGLRFIRPYAAMMAGQSARGREQWNHSKNAQMLHKMALGLEYLMVFSIGMFKNVVNDMIGSTKKGKLFNDPNIQKVVRRLDEMTNAGVRHPKCDILVELLTTHLSEAQAQSDATGEPVTTKCMVFCQFRDAVTEIVDALNDHGPMIRAHKFVGRATGTKSGEPGLKQNEQKQVIEKFRKDVYNVLVATSIGEEGLDIGEVDFIIIYNSPKTSIKALQRIGRAGRKRDGHIHVLQTAGREDRNFDTAMGNHREIQAEIIMGRNVDLYDDVDPMLPAMPKAVYQQMQADPFEPEVKGGSSKRKRATKSTGSAPKRQRGMPVPEGIGASFVKASALTKGGRKAGASAKRSGKKGRAQSSSEDEDEDDDSDLPSLGGGLREEDSERTSDESSVDLQTTVAKGNARAKGRKVTPKKITPKRNGAAKRKSTVKAVESDADPDIDMDPVDTGVAHNIFGDYSDASAGEDAAPPAKRSSGSEKAVSSLRNKEPEAQEVDMFKTPSNPRSALPPPGTGTSTDFGEMSGSWMLNVEDDEYKPQMAGQHILALPFKPPSMANRSQHMAPPSIIPARNSNNPQVATPLSDQSPIIARRRPGVRRVVLPSSDREDNSPLPRAAVARRVLPSDPPEESSPVAPPRGKKVTKPRPFNPFVADDVEVSEDDDGTENDSSGEESESDKRFAGHFEATQAPKGYNQRAAYMAGLATQAPQGGPAFANRSHMRTNFLAKARKPIMLSQEEERHGPSSEYDGSFVCGDETVEFESGSEGHEV